ncbi:MAG TPA: class I SAM-dependent methyltransferase [Methanotrichaceae archaeon]|nr:class I SAM-dependent methyltransferase [Methanotrichaceae archaeon]
MVERDFTTESGTSSALKEEYEFWQNLHKEGDGLDLRYARDLPDDTPEFILDLLARFEEDVTGFCFSGAGGRVLDAGCGNGNLLMRALEMFPQCNMSYVGMDFSRNMLKMAASRSVGLEHVALSQGCINRLPFKDEAFDRVISSGVITCLSSVDEATDSLAEFYRVLVPGGTLVVDFFNQASHFTLVRKHILREAINPPEYILPSSFKAMIEDAGFKVQAYRGFDYKPYQGYLFMSRWAGLIDPGFIQERFSRLVETRLVQRLQRINLLGYRIYIRCVKR